MDDDKDIDATTRQEEAINAITAYKNRDKLLFSPIELEQQLDAITHCAFLVALGDAKYSDEEHETLYHSRELARSFLLARPAVEKLIKTRDIKKASLLYAAQEPNYESAFYTEAGVEKLFNEISQARKKITRIEDLVALEKSYAARISEPYVQKIAITICQRVAGADEAFSGEEMQSLNNMCQVWEKSWIHTNAWAKTFLYPIVLREKFDPKTFDSRVDSEERRTPQIDTLVGSLGAYSFDDLLATIGGEDTSTLPSLRPRQEEADALLWSNIINRDFDFAVENLDAGADPNQSRDLSGIKEMTPLMAAAAFGSIRLVEKLLEKCAEIDTIQEKGYTALTWAVKYEHSEIVQILIAKGAMMDPLEIGSGEFSPLSMAARKGYAEILKKLLAAGADPDYVNNVGTSAVKAACTEDSPGHTECLKLLLKTNTASASEYDKEGFAPIHAACRTSKDTTLALIHHGIDIEQKLKVEGESAKTPLEISLSWGKFEIAKSLIENKANCLEIRDDGEVSALSFALSGGIDEGQDPTEIVELLTFLGAPVTRLTLLAAILAFISDLKWSNRALKMILLSCDRKIAKKERWQFDPMLKTAADSSKQDPEKFETLSKLLDSIGLDIHRFGIPVKGAPNSFEAILKCVLVTVIGDYDYSEKELEAAFELVKDLTKITGFTPEENPISIAQETMDEVARVRRDNKLSDADWEKYIANCASQIQHTGSQELAMSCCIKIAEASDLDEGERTVLATLANFWNINPKDFPILVGDNIAIFFENSSK